MERGSKGERAPTAYEGSHSTVIQQGWSRRQVLTRSLAASGVTLSAPVTAAQASTQDDWSQQAKLTASNGNPDDRFGSGMGVTRDGSLLVIGANEDQDPNGKRSGSAYVFERSDGNWSEQAKLVPNDGDAGDRFGSSVAVPQAGATAIIGAPYDADPNGEFAGAAYAFELPTTGTDSEEQNETESDTSDDLTGSPTPGFGAVSMLSAASVSAIGKLLWEHYGVRDDSK